MSMADNGRKAFELLRSGDRNGLVQLLAEDPSVASARNDSGVSLVMEALYRGQRDLAATLARNKPTLDIFEAAALGKLTQLTQLLQDRSLINTYSPDGFTALHFACYFGQPEPAKLLLDAGADPNVVAANPMQVMPLHSAASARNAEAVKLLLDHGAHVNARQQGGWTALHAAAQNGDLDVLHLLLDYGADPQAANDEGKTAVALALEKLHSEAAGLLDKASTNR